LFPTRRIVYIYYLFFILRGLMLCASNVFFVFDDPEGLNLYRTPIQYVYIFLDTLTANKRERNRTLYTTTTELKKDSEHNIFQLSYSSIRIVYIVHPTVIFSIMEWMLAAGLEHIRPTDSWAIELVAS
jgi:hypothetical protein